MFLSPHPKSSRTAPTSMLAITLFVTLALQCLVSNTVYAAPAQAPFGTTSNARNEAAKQAAQLSLPSAMQNGNQLKTESQVVNVTSPWREKHTNALPRPESFGKINTTIISHDKIIKNVTTKAGKSLVTETKTLDPSEPVLLQHLKNASNSAGEKFADQPCTTNDDSDDSDDSDGDAFPILGGNSNSTNTSTSCFPALDFDMPSDVPSSLKDWWCDPQDEYAFMGFSYAVDACQSKSQLVREFKDARKTFNARYIRIYSSCDADGFEDRVIDAAWSAGIGVQMLIWFGFDGTDIYKTRRTKLFNALRTNPRAKYVVRAVQFGSEPLYDWAISGTDLAKEVKKAQTSLSSLGINVTVSDMAYGYQTQEKSGSQDVLDTIDFIDAHMLPYFSQKASTGDKAWPINANDMKYFTGKAPGKKVYWSQTGWPSSHDCNAGVCPNSPDAVSNVKNEKAYFDLLDSKCTTLKAYPGGGVGWFAHLYSDDQGPGYGIYGTNGKTKFSFKPKTSC